MARTALTCAQINCARSPKSSKAMIILASGAIEICHTLRKVDSINDRILTKAPTTYNAPICIFPLSNRQLSAEVGMEKVGTYFIGSWVRMIVAKGIIIIIKLEIRFAFAPYQHYFQRLVTPALTKLITVIALT